MRPGGHGPLPALAWSTWQSHVTPRPQLGFLGPGFPGPPRWFCFPSLTLWPPGGSVNRQHPSRNFLLAQEWQSRSVARTPGPCLAHSPSAGKCLRTLRPRPGRPPAPPAPLGGTPLARPPRMCLVNSQQSTRPGLAIAWPSSIRGQRWTREGGAASRERAGFLSTSGDS